jgi:hypothetical protein
MSAIKPRRPPWLSLTLVPLMAAVALGLSSCETDGHFTLLGYTTRPNYRPDIRTVRVPIFKNATLRDSVRQGLEFELTRAVIREIEQKTPYKVVGSDCDADTELTGRIILLNKAIINRNQYNEVREAETTLGVEVVWKDLRSGEVLSRPNPRPGTPPPPPPEPGTPPPPPPPVLVTSLAGFIPELGESPTTAYKRNVDRLAQQIVCLMETPW